MRLKHVAIASLATGAAVVAVASQTDLAPYARDNLRWFGSVSDAPQAGTAPADGAQVQTAALTTEPSPAAPLPPDALAELTAALDERDGQLDRLAASLSKRDAEIDRLTESAGAREAEQVQAASAREAELAKTASMHESELAELNALSTRIEQLNATLHERDAELRMLRNEIKIPRELPGLEAKVAALMSSPQMQTVAFRDLGTDITPFDQALTAAKAGPDITDTPVVVTDRNTGLTVARALAPAALPAAMPAIEPAPMMAEVHFESNSARLTPGAQARARAAVKALEGMDLASIEIMGFTDTVGSASANAALGKARADAVADFLVEAGLPRELIQVAGMGETGAPVPTANGVAEPLNRCVGIMPVLAGDPTATASN